MSHLQPPSYQSYGYDPQPYVHPYPPRRPVPTAPPKSPGVALILSFVVPGLGHLYTGNPLSAVLWFVAAAVSAALISVLVGIILLPMVYVGACIHAYIAASSFNHQHPVVR